MIFKDLNGKIREGKELKKIKNNIWDTINKVNIVKDYIEITIIGKNRSWKQFYPLEEFEKINPEINYEFK